MEVSVSELRANLRDWLARSRAGEDVVVTDRGKPVARIVGIDSMDLIERLTREGVLSPPLSPHKRKATMPKVKPTPGSPISDLISEMRR